MLTGSVTGVTVDWLFLTLVELRAIKPTMTYGCPNISRISAPPSISCRRIWTLMSRRFLGPDFPGISKT